MKSHARWGLGLLLLGMVLRVDGQPQPMPRRPEPDLFNSSAPFRLVVHAALDHNSGRALPAEGFVVAPSSREQSRQFYNAVFQASEGVDIRWSGSYATGAPGTTSSDFKEAVRRRINYFRAMAGVPADIRFSSILNRKCQQAALMMSANRALSHNPPPDWIFFTAEGAEAAANSNLAIGSNGPEAILGLMRDNGDNNSALGHRRWFLYPPTQTMGTGDVPREGNSNFAANATWVFDESGFGKSVPTRDGFVAWPPPGFVPYKVAFPRWSFAFPGADFTQTTVQLTRSGTNMPVRIEPVQNGFGEETIAWVVDNLPTDDFQHPGWSKPVADQPVRVLLNNVRINGESRNFEYTVTVFDPATSGPDTTVTAVVAGPTTMAPGQTGSFSFRTSPIATAYEQRTAVLAPAALEGAESRLAGVTAETSNGYNPIVSTRRSGSFAFHLAMPDFANQFLTLNPDFLIQEGGRLVFFSQLGFATQSQVAEVQISLDSGGTWRTIYSQAGNSTAGERAFVQRQVDLSPFVGQVVKFRFAYLFSSGTAFTDVANTVGWLIDDIQVQQGLQLQQALIAPTSGAGLSQVSFASAGDQMVQFRPLVFGGFPIEWGPAMRIVVGGAAQPRIVSIARAVDGRVRLGVQEVPASGQLVLEFSGDLRSWIEVLRQNSSSGEVLFNHQPAVGPSSGYYRIRIP